MKFYASLGNHDDPTQRFYKNFNMNGERFYTFKAPKTGLDLLGGVRGSSRSTATTCRPNSSQWLEKELKASGSDWKIPFFHHPLYSSGEKHGADAALREQLEPLFVKYGVDVVFTGHEHFYERIKPQKGITYFVNGSAAKLRKGNIGTVRHDREGLRHRLRVHDRRDRRRRAVLPDHRGGRPDHRLGR